MGKGRAACCDKNKVKKGPWSCEEDLRLITFIQKHGHQNWRSLPKQAGLLRCGKSCRLRWINYLRPDVKRGNFTPQEHDTILKLHQSFGNKWSKIASHLPGRTDNEIKNVWNTHLKKRLHRDQAKLDDSTSVLSHAINKGQVVMNMVNEKEEEKKSCSSYNSASISSPNINVELRRVHDDGVIEIPLECDDVDIWDMLDIMDPSPSSYPPNADDHSKLDNNEVVCEGLSEFEWFTYFENELLGV